MRYFSNQRNQHGSFSSHWVAPLLVLGIILASGFFIYFRQPAFDTTTAAIDGLPGTSGVNRVPADSVVKTIDGNSLKISDLKGKVVILNFWATWCQYCRGEIPHQVQLAQAYRARGLEVVGLTIEDPVADVEKVKMFMRRFNMNYPVGFSSQELFETYIGPGEQPLPQTLVFDRHGKLQAHVVGFNDKRDPQRLESLITRLL